MTVNRERAWTALVLGALALVGLPMADAERRGRELRFLLDQNREGVTNWSTGEPFGPAILEPAGAVEIAWRVVGVLGVIVVLASLAWLARSYLPRPRPRSSGRSLAP